jgi:hypothetical protein
MAQLSGNTCEVITLLPLGVICNTTNSSTPQTPNGSIYLQITGGSAPYNVTWSNGGQGQSLINLKSGDYTATVVDYYGDYSATTTCTVGFDSFFLDWFEDCENPSNYLYYTAQQPSIFTSGLTYQLNGQTGCWTSNGTTLWTGQTFINDFASVSSGPFNSCVECLPEPIPPPVYPQYICLKKDTAPYTQYTFESGSTITNGFPVWSETGSTGYFMFYRGNGTWINVFGTGNSITLNRATAPPLGSWNRFGTTETWASTSGICPTITPPQIDLELDNPSCEEVTDGSIIVTASEGTPSYQYSLDGISYGTSPRFINLGAGSGTVYVKDSAGQVVTKTYTLINESAVKTYTFTKNITQTTLTNTSNEKRYKYTAVIEVSPNVESPDVITGLLSFDWVGIYADNGDASTPEILSGITTSSSGNVILSSVTNNSSFIISNGSALCANVNSTSIDLYLESRSFDIPFTITGSATITLEVIYGGKVYTVPSGKCRQSIEGTHETRIKSIKISNNTKCSTISSTVFGINKQSFTVVGNESS